MYINRKGIQFSKRDTFDCSTLGNIIVSWLKKFKEDYKENPFEGCPVDYLPKDKVEFSDDEFSEGQALFIADIDKMIWAFSVDNMPEDCWLVEPTKGLFDGELDYKKIDEHRVRIEAGRKLFAERFGNLWI